MQVIKEEDIQQRLGLLQKVESLYGLNSLMTGTESHPFDLEKLAKNISSYLLKARERSVFLDSISHDLKNYIFVAQNFYKKSKDSERFTKPRQKELLQKSYRAMNMALDCFESALNLDGETLEDDRGDISLSEEVISACEFYKLKYRDKSLECLIDIENGVHASLNKDVLVKCVIYPVFDNAFKFSPNFHKIKVKLDKSMVLTVENYGQSISNEQKEMIFNPNKLFTRLGPNGEKGIGSSLGVAKALVEKSGGELTLLSDEDRIKVQIKLP